VVAGKTGTSNDYRDSWFAGYSGGHLIVVWMGHDDNAPTGLTGTTGALQAWTRLMASISTNSFEPLMPDGVENRWIDYFTGLETSPYCRGVSLPFPNGMALAPSPTCPPGTTEEEAALIMMATDPTGTGSDTVTAPADGAPNPPQP
jgi:penicillin-binding protein 1B